MCKVNGAAHTFRRICAYANRGLPEKLITTRESRWNTANRGIKFALIGTMKNSKICFTFFHMLKRILYIFGEKKLLFRT